MRLRQTRTHQDNRSTHTTTVRTDGTAAGAVTVLRRAGAAPHVTDTMGARMARELAAAGRYSIGWVAWEVIP